MASFPVDFVLQPPPERLEISLTLEALGQELDDLVVRGLSAAGADDLRALQAMHDDLQRAGAAHLAGRIEALLLGVREGRADAAITLLRLQSALRVYERVLTLDTVGELLAPDEDDP